MEVEKKAMDAILQEGVDFAVEKAHSTWLDKKLKTDKKKFIMYPITMGSLLKISKIYLSFDKEDLDVFFSGEHDKSDFGLGLDFISKYSDRLIEIIAIAITNTKQDPPKSLVRFLSKNVTPKEILKILIVAVAQMDVTDFLASMAFVSGMNLTKVKQTTGESLADLSSTLDSQENKSSGTGHGKTS